MSLRALAVDGARTSPAIAVSYYLNFVSMYGASIVTTLTIGWIISQWVMRYREHKRVMARKEEDNGGD